MRFSLLGPLVVADDAGGRVALDGPRLRVLLTALLLDANVPVPAGELAEMVWDGAPPPSATVTLRSYVKRLRSAVDPGAARIAARHTGYIIHVEQAELDVLEFEALGREARAALRAGEWADAFRAATRALGLWRAAPLLDVPGEVLHRQFVPRLERLRLRLLEDRFDAGLRLGRHQELVPQLLEAAERHPLQERFHAQLMLALASTGQRAQALHAYQQARRVLVDELGIEPGQELRDVHRQILADEAVQMPGRADSIQPGEVPGTTVVSALTEVAGALTEVAGALTGLAGSNPEPVIPRELPAPVAHFAGREAEIAELTALLDKTAGQVPGTLVISAIGGTGGVGKTALAVHWAHQIAGQFPDGQLHVNLRGYDLEQPVTVADALARFLRALGVPREDIPPDEDERAAWYRTRLAGKRMLIVLDNARSAEQVRPLLPGAPSCLVVVTSRDALAGLVARDGAARLDLDLLPLEEAVSLLRALIGPRADADPEAAALLAQQCSRLPLALRVAAELAGARGDVPLADLVDELGDEQQRLSLLDAGGDPRTAIRAVFSWSYRHLDTGTARTFRLASLHPGPDFSPHAAAALTSATLEDSSGVLDLLARVHLIQQAREGQYSMHDLLRAYARDLASAYDGEDGQHAALTRLLDYYLHSAAAAMDFVYPAERHRRPRVPPAATPAPAVAEPAAARGWLDAERANLVAITTHAATHGWPAHATQLADTLFRYLAAGSYCQDAITIYTHAGVAARQADDLAAEANSLDHIAGVYFLQSRYQQAADHLGQALALFRQIGDHGRAADMLSNLVVICLAQGRYQEASTLNAQALDTYRQAGDLTGEMKCLGNLGNIEVWQGRYPQAARHHRQALAIARKLDDHYTERPALLALGETLMRQGDLSQADSYLGQALTLCRETSDRYYLAKALTRTGDVRVRQGRHQEARDHLQEALALYQEISDRSGEADALNSLGEALLAAGQPSHARDRHATVREIASDIGDTYQQARAYNGLACAHHALARPDQARDHWEQALALYSQLGVPEADHVRARLADTGPER
jgi:DNA-binding SARP family transcriptional activator/uncharacterized protein HemY